MDGAWGGASFSKNRDALSFLPYSMNIKHTSHMFQIKITIHPLNIITILCIIFCYFPRIGATFINYCMDVQDRNSMIMQELK
jgi:hypothetical protein